MGNLNKVMIIGRLCAEPEKKITPSGAEVLNISLAVNETWKDKQGEKQERTEFFRLVCWNHIANIIHKYCQKGSQIYVDGSLQTREWQDKEGNTRYTTEVNVRNVQLLDSRSSDNQQNKQGTNQYQQKQQDIQQGMRQDRTDDFVEHDLPF